MRKTKVKRLNPANCLYWHNPKHIQSGPLKDRFELIKTYVKTDQFWCYLLRCRECDHLYFMEFRESTDWVNSNDPQFTVYVPVTSIKEGDRVYKNGCRSAVPRLHIDFPSDAPESSVYWVAESNL